MNDRYIDVPLMMILVSLVSFITVHGVYTFGGGYGPLNDVGIPSWLIIFYPVYMLPVIAEILERLGYGPRRLGGV